MASPFVSVRRVEFCETDAAGIAHFSSLIIYMEQAEHSFLRSLGLSVAASNTSKHHSSHICYTWPRVKVECEFQSPARFEDLIEIETSLAKLGSKSVTYQHRLSVGGASIAFGKMTSVCCILLGDSLSSHEIPTQIRELLIAYLA